MKIYFLVIFFSERENATEFSKFHYATLNANLERQTHKCKLKRIYKKTDGLVREESFNIKVPYLYDHLLEGELNIDTLLLG